MSNFSGIVKDHEIDAPKITVGGQHTPYNAEHFETIGVLKVWEKYADFLSWGEG